MNELNHLAIIMDGNGRWAKKRGLIRTLGHEKGADNIEKICNTCIKNSIKNLTLYAFSTENWSRPQKEIDYLMNLFTKFLSEKKALFIKENIKFKTIGNISVFEKDIKEQILELEQVTKENLKMTLCLAINYGSKDEIIRACNKLLQDKKEINEQNIGIYLDTNTMGDVDMLIRTGGQKRLSNFLLWQASYAELFFTDTLWPDFSENELQAMIDSYKLIERKFGGL